MMKKYLFLLLVVGYSGLSAQTPHVEITTKNDSDREKATARLLQEVLSDYDLSQWVFTRQVVIEQMAIPHSHPVLTLNTRSSDKTDILDTFVHEQLHWYVDKKPDAEKAAIDAFKKKYKEVPYQNAAGARDEYSTYLHLIVCYLEYRSMAMLIGENDAKQLMWNQTHYTWIYNKVIEDTAYLSKVLRKNGFDLVK
ncbi:MAG: hypothetical protein RIF36_15780 [Imperialibacter sp.]|uniref:hypothetical protein n=1 Tax=Imperialibacter sp. TaxID=2038411 RepID=UPI0032F08A35